MNGTVRKAVVISNDLGIHLRAAGVLVQLAGKFTCDIWIERDKQRANAKSIMSVLALAASKGTKVTLEAQGEDAEEAVGALAKLIEEGFHTE